MCTVIAGRALNLAWKVSVKTTLMSAKVMKTPLKIEAVIRKLMPRIATSQALDACTRAMNERGNVAFRYI
jgi:hypothetical protein